MKREIVIELDDIFYETLLIGKRAKRAQLTSDATNILFKAVVIGTPQPKTEVLDKIRTEIEHLTYYWCEVNPKTVIDDVLQIIDKYKAESEE